MPIALLCLSPYAAATAVAHPIAVLGTDTATLRLNGFMEQLHDETGTLALSEVRQGPHSRNFTTVPAEGANHGFTNNKVYWYRTTVSNTAAKPSDRVLEFGYPLLDKIDLYVVRSNGKIETTLTGDRRPRPAQQRFYRSVAVPLNIMAGERAELYARVETQSTHLVSLTLWDSKAFDHHVRTENLWFGIYCGAMFALALFNLLILLSVRESSYTYYVVFIVVISALQLDLHGLAQLHVWGGWPVWSELSVPVLIVMPAIFSVLFSRTFLQTKVHAPVIHRALNITLAALLVCLGITLFVPYSISTPLNTFIAAVVSVVLVAAGVATLLGKVRAARYYLLAWSIYLVAVVLRALEGNGLLPSNFLTDHGLIIGSAALVILLSLALGDRISAINMELERRVRQKHRELEDSYRGMEALRHRDAIAQERERIMRDLHDGLGGQLVAALTICQDQHTAQPAIEETLRGALDDMRLVVDSLDPIANDLPVLLGTVRGRFEPRLAQLGIRFEWQVQDLPAVPNLGPDHALHVLRIVQEAITNILKHAQARTVTVRTGTKTPKPGHLIAAFVEVVDDGIGLAVQPRSGRGLHNMRERALRIGGQIEFDGSHQGTVVRLWLPTPAAA